MTSISVKRGQNVSSENIFFHFFFGFDFLKAFCYHKSRLKLEIFRIILIMNKRQTVWLIVRFIGVCFIFWAILSLFGAFSDYFSSGSASSATNSNTNTVRVQAPTPQIVNPALPVPKSENQKAEDKAKSDALKTLAWQIFIALIYGGIGFYLIRNGKILFTTLIREDSMDETEEITYSTSAESKEKVVTSLDISPSSSSKKEEVTSLNLSEYVPKAQQTAPPIANVAEEKSITEKTETEPILAAEENSRMDYALPAVENNQTETPNDSLAAVPNEPTNQAFFADETPTLIRHEMPSEEIPPAPTESPIVENEVKKRVRKVKEIAPDETIGEQPKETAASSDISDKSEQPA